MIRGPHAARPPGMRRLPLPLAAALLCVLPVTAARAQTPAALGADRAPGPTQAVVFAPIGVAAAPLVGERSGRAEGIVGSEYTWGAARPSPGTAQLPTTAPWRAAPGRGRRALIGTGIGLVVGAVGVGVLTHNTCEDAGDISCATIVRINATVAGLGGLLVGAAVGALIPVK
jgi:hypothetical protein